MSGIKFEFMPTTADFVSTALSAAAAYGPGGGTPTQGALEQFVAILVAKNIAANTEVLDRADGALIQEHDIWTTVSRTGYSAYYNRGTNRIFMDGAKGALCNIVGRYVEKLIGGSATL